MNATLRFSTSKTAALALLALTTVLAATPASAAALGEPAPANAVVMPFDVSTPTSMTQLLVRNVSGTSASNAALTANWSFYADGRHLANVWTCLPLGAEVMVDPRRLSGIEASGESIGPVIDLSSHRGIVVVTAFETDDVCSDGSTSGFVLLDDAIVGQFSIRKGGIRRAYGASALGFHVDPSGQFTDLPDVTDSSRKLELSVRRQNRRDFSQIVLVGLAERSGEGPAGTKQLGPLSSIAASTLYVHARTGATPLRGVSFSGSRFTQVAELLPFSVSPIELRAPAFVQFRNLSASGAPLGAGQLVFAIHGEVSKTFPTTTYAVRPLF